jgi:hypothetical protein
MQGTDSQSRNQDGQGDLQILGMRYLNDIRSLGLIVEKRCRDENLKWIRSCRYIVKIVQGNVPNSLLDILPRNIPRVLALAGMYPTHSHLKHR